MNILILTILILISAFLLLAVLGRFIEHPFEARKNFNFNEKWTVSLSKYGNENAIMDEFYLYTLNFIYGDYDQKLKTNSPYSYVNQKIGKAPGCKIRFSGAGIADQHGKLSFHQDFGLLYEDLTYKVSGSNTIKKACVNGPYGTKNSVCEKYIPITDGLKLYISDYVLTFKSSYERIFKNADDEIYDPEENKNEAPVLLKLLVKLTKKFLTPIPIGCYRVVSKGLTFLKSLESKLSKMAE